MSDVAVSPRARLGTGLFLGAAAVAAVVTYLAFPSGSREQGLASGRDGHRRVPALGGHHPARGRPGRRRGAARCYLAYALFMIGAVNVVFLPPT